MRKANREVKDIEKIVEVMKKCEVCRIALNDEEYPYILPLSFGMDCIDGKVTLYFHSALEGTKLNLIRRDNRASFEVDCEGELEYIREKGYCTYAYESVIGSGRIIMVEDEDDKIHALRKLMQQYHGGKDVPFSRAALPRTAVYKLVVEKITCKQKPKMPKH